MCRTISERDFWLILNASVTVQLTRKYTKNLTYSMQSSDKSTPKSIGAILIDKVWSLFEIFVVHLSNRSKLFIYA